MSKIKNPAGAKSSRRTFLSGGPLLQFTVNGGSRVYSVRFDVR